jgi:UDP-N-acetyl-2-amino-2-deoxyglucuronate dehydrogenase
VSERRILNFGLIGAAGYIASRHLRAIKETGNNLIAALDKFDSVGIMDHFFPQSDFFVEFERFDRHFDKLKRQGTRIDYVSICTPNYLHDSHIRFALRQGTDAICEKPLVLNPWNIYALSEIELETGKRIFNILQLRLHPVIKKLKLDIENGQQNRIHDIDLTYITSRGKWYDISWKGNIQKSGGIATNIGVHFFDMLTWIFGNVNENIVHVSEPHRAAGYLGLERARVRWFLSIDTNDLPQNIKEKGQNTYRSILINGSELEFSEGFTELHNKSYEAILSGSGFGVQEARNSTPIGLKGDFHPICKPDLI